MRFKVLLLKALIIPLLSFAQYTAIPDNNFEQALIDQGIDSEGGPTDGQVLTSDISGLTNLDVSSNFISDLTGISAFTSLQTLDCSFNNLIALDLFNNTALLEIDCGENNIGNSGNQLILPNNNILTSLVCRGNNLSGLDVSSYPDLEVLQCYNNGPSSIGTLNLSANTKLIDLICHNAGITSLDISNCINLDTLWCFSSYGSPPNSNTLPTLDISSNLALSEVRCYNSGINTIALSAGSYNNLIYLDCGDNNLTSLDSSKFPNIETLWFYYNNISSTNFTNNAALRSLDCGGNTSLNSVNISMLTNLERFWCYDNSFTSIDASANTNLILFNSNSNANLTSVDLPDTITLEVVSVCCSNLSTLDFTNNTGLTYLDIGINNFTSADVSMLSNLEQFYGNSNQLTYLNIANGNIDNLNWMWAQNNMLDCIQVDDLAKAGAKSSPNWQRDIGADFSLDCSLGLEDAIISNIKVYPNPVVETLNIDSKHSGKYSINDILGKSVSSGEINDGLSLSLIHI